MQQVAAIQMTSTADLQQNLADATGLLRRAKERGAELAVLPENFAGYGGNYRELADHYPMLTDWLVQQARDLEMAIIGGSIPDAVRPDGTQVPAPLVRTRCLALDAHGYVQGQYDKLHLFDAQVGDAQGRYRESSVFEAGDKVVTASVAGLNVGLAICYDLRFPALALRLASQGAQLLVYPSAFTAVTGAAHWELLLRATAVQSGCFVLGANQCGQHSARRASYGRSMLVNPWGEVVGQLQNSPDVLVAPLDLATMEGVRESMPTHLHQRFSIKGPHDLEPR